MTLHLSNVLDPPRRDQHTLLDRVRCHRHRDNQGHGGNHRHLFELRVSQKTAKDADHINGAYHIADQLTDGAHSPSCHDC